MLSMKSNHARSKALFQGLKNEPKAVGLMAHAWDPYIWEKEAGGLSSTQTTQQDSSPKQKHQYESPALRSH